MAQYKLGMAYSYGQGTQQNDAEAATWYLHAGSQGLAAAQYILAVNYEHGRGVPQDVVEALKWYHLATLKGNKAAAEYRDALIKQMTPEQITESKKRAAAFVPKKSEPAGK